MSRFSEPGWIHEKAAGQCVRKKRKLIGLKQKRNR